MTTPCVTRRHPVLGLGAALLVSALCLAADPGRADAQGDVQKIRFGFANKSLSPIVANFLIPEYLGYYKQEGLSVEVIPLGSNAAVMASLESNRVEFGVGVAAFQVPLVAKGDRLPAVNFVEYTYPFKFAVAVKRDSGFTTLVGLKGKKIGVTAFGRAEFLIGKVLLRKAGLDPERDVSWVAVGEGTTAGQALARRDIEALVNDDIQFGALEAAGIDLRYLPLPVDLPKVGGVYLSATRETLAKHRPWAIGFARAVAKAQLFIQENPEAAAWIFLQVAPEAAPKGKAIEEQVKAILVPVAKRMPLYRHYDPKAKWGYINPGEWEDEIEFWNARGKIKDPSVFFTNELIDEVNRFDPERVKAEARAFKLPYKR